MLSEIAIIEIVQSVAQETGKITDELTNEDMLKVIAKSIHRALQYNNGSDNTEITSRLRSKGYKI